MEPAWKSIEGFPGYEVSDTGLVRSWHRPRNRSAGEDELPRLLVGGRDKDGYRRAVFIAADKSRVSLKFHTIVLNTFVGKRAVGMVARHLDGDKCNNAVANLCWGTQQENIDDRGRHGTTARGERSGQRKAMRARKLDEPPSVKAEPIGRHERVPCQQEWW